MSAVTGTDGSYELAVPVGSTVTAYIQAAGHRTIHVQTFTFDAAHDGTELDGVNFQTPSDDVFEALRALIGGFVGRDPFTDGCVIVTTVGDARMVGMSFDEFIDFHPHGVAGASASLDPPDRDVRDRPCEVRTRMGRQRQPRLRAARHPLTRSRPPAPP